MTADYEPLLLLEGDRLGPTVALPNVVNFFALHVFPFSVMFGAPRMKRRRVTEIFCFRSFVWDGTTTHSNGRFNDALYLGVRNVFCRGVWTLLCSDIWGDICPDGENAQVGCVMFKAVTRRL